METTVDRIKEYLNIINPELGSVDENIVEFVINEVIDRVELYLNRDDIPVKIERIIAQVINTSLKKCLKNSELSLEADKAVSSMSDNGQSISYNNEITRYFSSASDEEILSGFSHLMRRYRRINVVYPADIQK